MLKNPTKALATHSFLFNNEHNFLKILLGTVKILINLELVMPYSHPVMNKFTNAIANKINCKITSELHNQWSDHYAKIEQLREESNKKNDIKSLLFFLKAIVNAKMFTELSNKYPSVLDQEERKEHICYLDKYFDLCITKFMTLQKIDSRLKDIEIPVKEQTKKTTPTKDEPKQSLQQIPVKTSSSSNSMFAVLKNTATTVVDGISDTWNKLDHVDRTEEVTNFVNSTAFQELVNYHKNILKNDTRDHTFFFSQIDLKVEKAPVLQKFIERIENSKNMAQVKRNIAQFYNGINNSDYDTLNRGQNITTRVFNLVGMKSTTIGLINELSKPFLEELLSQASLKI